MARLGRTLVIANPAAQNGKGRQGAEFVERFLQGYESATDGFEVTLTDGPGHAERIARGADGTDTVIALGGDGVIHETVNGLMGIDASSRPRLGVIALGSGNDYARTLHVEQNAPEASLGQLFQGKARRLDLGRVNGTYFVETLSFGLDAAIALDTMQKRVENGEHGTRLFASSGIEMFRDHLRDYAYEGTLDEEHVSGRSVVFAVQVGPTYGGGFKVCPAASPTDGKLDVCRSVRTPSVPRTLALFAQARMGLHVGSSVLDLRRVTHMTLDFEEALPCQADGERVEGTHFEIESVPGALEVIVPNSFRY
ncbi:MAG: diacylglycerol kinase family lipid kinase [Atopobiaceae bacterium]|jgi:YegS/Rv2252/BmrU family lipid kinase|nr:diacylglycerol kinase family lipid kinase [Atopobiaceae bacterium]MCI2172882.1 diacylglycerol kinase family lipid kinase [Atopobiaceae bacterium]MCI2208287.1 diacylglycerol kinase family lipid kinase [Atopobiaceae bacterium]